MILRTAFLTASIVGLAAPSMGVASDNADKTTVCHRTGRPASAGLFPGVVINVSGRAVSEHVALHNDLVIGPEAASRLRNGASCFTDARGNVFDGGRNVIQFGPGQGGPNVPPDGGPG